ncbi:MAG: cytochrome P450 [Acidimicrobiia bacterium]|jgi:cytochrome P450 family 142 subfamily A polypeptide 1
MTVTIPDFTTGRAFDDPWDAYRWLRENDPVHWSEAGQCWVLTRHAEVSYVSRHADLYCSKHGVRPRNAQPLSILTMDDPQHQRQRGIINRGFTPRQVRRLAPHIREITEELLNDIQDRGEIEFVSDFAIHVPLIVIAELMGLDPGMRSELHRWSDDMMAGEGRSADDPTAHVSATAALEFVQYLLPLIEERRAEPREDLISILTGAFDEGTLDTGSATTLENTGTMESDDLIIFLIALLVAGNETTRNAISGGLLAFSRFPEEREKLITNPELIDGAVEEIVRFVSPVLSFSRTVTADHELGGKQLAEGDRVLMLYQSANRDELVFADADTFRIDRSPNPHLGFGFGPHYCLGANLARLEIQIVFEELFKRLRDIRMADGATFSRGDNALVVAIEQIPAVFTPIRV